MATLSQLHIPLATIKSQLLYFSRSAAPRFSLPYATARFATLSSGSLRISYFRIPNVVAAATRIPQDLQAQGDGDADGDTEVVCSNGGEFQWDLVSGLVAAGVLCTTPAWPAHALINEDIEEMMRFSPEAWVNIYITTGIWLVLYFLLIPLGVYNYLRLRWYKRSSLETYFQFMLVFIFFPGMLLLAPFINFRRFPNDGAEEP